MPSTSCSKEAKHVGVIMDGNGRWASARGLTRSAGHRRGADAVRRCVEAAPDLGIEVLTLFAFSSDNWGRPRAEVDALLLLFERFLRQERSELAAKGVRINVIGRRDRLRTSIVRAIAATEAATRRGRTLLLRLAVDYSARDAIMRAGRLPPRDDLEATPDFERRLAEVTHSVGGVPDLDLVIRTSGEQRLSDFLLWESAYAELVFAPVLWPDFRAGHLAAALDEFRGRNRRFGCRPALAS